MITDDIEMRRKKKTSLLFHRSKTKLGLTTNYVLGLSDTSEKTRLHIVDLEVIGINVRRVVKNHRIKNILVNYYSLTLSNDWNKPTTMGLDVSNYISQKWISETDDIWYETKQLRVVVEGTDGTGEVFDWMNKLDKDNSFRK